MLRRTLNDFDEKDVIRLPCLFDGFIRPYSYLSKVLAKLSDLILNDREAGLILDCDVVAFHDSPCSFVVFIGGTEKLLPNSAEIFDKAKLATDTRTAVILHALMETTPLHCDLFSLICGLAVKNDWRDYFVSVERPLDNSDEGLDSDEVNTVMAQTYCCPQYARRALRKTGNIVDAILFLTP